ncbi:MAG: DUF1150 family protein [Alphaproteobacteria bacterium]
MTTEIKLHIDDRSQLEELMMAMVGLETMAYIKPIVDGRRTSYAVFAADGTQLAVFDSAESAYYNAVRHNLAPVSLH